MQPTSDDCRLYGFPITVIDPIRIPGPVLRIRSGVIALNDSMDIVCAPTCDVTRKLCSSGRLPRVALKFSLSGLIDRRYLRFPLPAKLSLALSKLHRTLFSLQRRINAFNKREIKNSGLVDSKINSPWTLRNFPSVCVRAINNENRSIFICQLWVKWANIERLSEY